MGTWGMGLFDNDHSADVYAEYMDLYDDGMDVQELRERLIRRYRAFDHDHDFGNFWCALAQAEWECGVLHPQTSQIVQYIIDSGCDADAWHGSDKVERRQALNALAERLSSPRARPRQRVKYVVAEQPLYPEGTCLALRLYVGGYGAAIVLRNVVYGKLDECVSTLIGGLRGVFPQPPSMETFDRREWLYLTHHRFEGKLHITWCSQHKLCEDREKCIVVGRTMLRPEDPIAEIDQLRIGHGGIGWVENQIWKQDHWDRGIR